jgi:formimidoylglutamate deiminase
MCFKLIGNGSSPTTTPSSRAKRGDPKGSRESAPLDRFAALAMTKTKPLIDDPRQPTPSLHLAQALTPEGWRRDVRLTWNAGAFTEIEIGVAPRAGEATAAIGVPGIANLHSHAFQRAMAGLTERRGPGDDNFWSWREAMYRFGLRMNPDQAEAIAAWAYVEMLESGFTRVGEFHYLHHAPDGGAYDDIAEMAARVAAAAERTRIGLTLLPVFYAHSDVGGKPPVATQRRFLSDLDGFARLVDRSRELVAGLDGANMGLAPHSLRAVDPRELLEIVSWDRAAPLHIHVAEQTGEVDACLAWSGARPAQYLLDHAPVGPNWCFIHATHMLPEETRRLAASGATVGLCPITEANLGDGVFDAPTFLAAGGRFGIGTDSNVHIALTAELRMLEYAQRLARRARNIVAAPGGSTGRALFDGALRGGAAALDRKSGFAIGADADIVTLREREFEPDGDAWLDGWVFSNGAAVDSVHARGRRVVEDGAHVGRAAARDRFRATMRELLAM